MTDQPIWNGAPEMQEWLVPISELTRHPQNPRLGDVEAIASSLSRFGQVRAVLCDAEGKVIAGNHTLLAAESLGWTHVAVVRNEFASEEEARAYLLADNHLGDIGEYEQTELLALVAELEESGHWEGTGYQEDDLTYLRNLAGEIGPDPELEPLPAPVTPPQLRELVLLFREEQQGRFAENVRKLRERYELEGVTETVLRAVRDEALAVNQGAS